LGRKKAGNYEAKLDGSFTGEREKIRLEGPWGKRGGGGRVVDTEKRSDHLYVLNEEKIGY